jgi:hypothetical protein
MLSIAQTVIECRNCGDGGGLAVWASFAAVAVASGALWISAREHKAYMRQLRARARFSIELRVDNYDHDATTGMEDEAGTIRPVFRLKIDNYGERASAATLINVLVPREYASTLRWSGPKGGELPTRTPFDSDELVTLPDGAQVATTTLSGVIPRITRSGGQIEFFCFTVRLPDTGDQIAIPIRVLAHADEIPDDVPEYSGSMVFRARRVQQNPWPRD